MIGFFSIPRLKGLGDYKKTSAKKVGRYFVNFFATQKLRYNKFTRLNGRGIIKYKF